MSLPNLFLNEKTDKKRYSATYYRVSALMLDRGYKHLSALAFDCGVSRQMLSSCLHGHIRFPESLKIKISQILKCDSRVLFPAEAQK